MAVCPAQTSTQCDSYLRLRSVCRLTNTREDPMANHPWLRSYPAGVEWTSPVAVAPIPQILDDAVAKWADRPAIDFMGRKIAYRELGALVDRSAKGLQ